jgi:hypothetical protein
VWVAHGGAAARAALFGIGALVTLTLPSLARQQGAPPDRSRQSRHAIVALDSWRRPASLAVISPATASPPQSGADRRP